MNTIDDTRRDRAALVEALGERFIRGNTCRCPDPAHEDSRPSASIFRAEDGAFKVKCHGCGWHGDMFDVIAATTGRPLADVLREARGTNGNGPRPAKAPAKVHTRYKTIDAAVAACERFSGGKCVARWDYETSNQFHIVRLDLEEIDPNTGKPEKQFRPIHHDGQGYVVADPPDALLPLYRRARIEGAQRVYVFEGEHCVEVAETVGLIAITSSHGSKSAKKSDWSWVRGKHVVIVPDNDDAGRQYGIDVAHLSNKAGAASVRIVELPGLAKGEDIVEFVAARECVESETIAKEVESLADAAPPWTPPATDEVQDKPARRKRAKRETSGPPDLGQGLTRRLADSICSIESFAKDGGGKLYVFTGGVYRPTGDSCVAHLVKLLLNNWDESESWSTKRASEVVEYIRVDAPQLWERPPLDRVNVLNGIVDVAARTLKPHDPAFLSPVQIPVRFDRDATCPAWERFVASSFPPDAQSVAWEIVAWLMLPDVSIQKAILLIGEGSNGKSVYLCAVIAFLGKRNIATVPLHKLEADRFSASRLVGKLANICADLPSAHLAGTSMFKALTGGDTISGERKHVDSFDFDPYARLIFSANHPPRSEDSTHAFFRRWIVIPFHRTFDPDGPDFIPRDALDAQLADPAEQSGVLNRALDALANIRTNRGITESPSMREAWSEFRETTDPLAVWLESNTTEHPEIFTTKADLQAAYNRSREAVGEPSMTNMAFGLAIRRLRPSLKDAQRTVGSKVVKVWLGVGLRDSSTSPASPTSSIAPYPRQPSFQGYVEGE